MSRAEMAEEIASLKRMLEEARVEADHYQTAVRWALGEIVHDLPAFPCRPEGGPPYWWRSTLRGVAYGPFRRQR